MLEEEALLQSIEERPVCPGCGRHVNEKWLVCPNCHTKLKKVCSHCGKLMKLPWSLCPYCGTPEKGKKREGITVDEAVQALELEEDKRNAH